MVKNCDGNVGTICSVYICLMILSTVRNVYNYYYGDKYKNIEQNVLYKLTAYEVVVVCINCFIMYSMCKSCHGLLGLLATIGFSIVSFVISLFLMPNVYKQFFSEL